MKKKTKLILTSVATIAMSASLIAGGTFALFTDKASVNVAVQAGDVDIEAYVVEKSLETFSIAWDDKEGDYKSLPTAQVGVFTNGGTAAFNDDYSELKLDLVSPGDSVKFTIDVENKSNISIQYRVVMEVEGTLADALVATAEIEGEVYAIDGVDTKATLWKGIPGGQAIEDINVEIDFPNADDNNEFKNASATIKYSVEAVQGNGHVVDHKVDATTKLQNAFTAGGNVEAPDLLLQPTETVWVGRNDVTLGKATLTNANMSAGETGVIMTEGLGSNFTLAENAKIEVKDLGRETYAIGSIFNGDITLEEGSKIVVDGANSVGIEVQNFVNTPATKIYLNDSNLIEVSNGATGISVDGGGSYEIYVETYADYLYYKGITKNRDNTAVQVTWYINGDKVEVNEAVVTTGESVATALQNGATKVTVNGAVTHKGSFTNGNNELAFVGTGAETSSITIPAVGGNYPSYAEGMDVTYQDITVVKDNKGYNGVKANSETYINCVIENELFLYANEVVFTNCTFEQTADAYNVWTYAAKKVTFNNCTFNSAGKSVLVYNEGATGTEVIFNNCVLNASAPVEGKAAVEIDSNALSGNQHHYITFNNTVENGFAVGSKSNETLYNEKKGDKATVYVDGYEVIVYGLNKQVANGQYYIVNESGLAACGETYFEQGGVYNLTTNLDMTDVAYIIPNVELGVNLTIDGQGYAISNFTLVGSTYSALLGYVSGNVTIKNLTIKDSVINSQNNVDGKNSAATFIAYIEKGNEAEATTQVVIDGCVAENVTLGSCKYVGGFVGYQSNVKLTITNSTVKACNIVNTYSETENGVVEYKGHAGGFVGVMYYGVIENVVITDTVMQVESPRGGLLVGSILDKDVTIGGTIINVLFNGVANTTRLVGAYDYRA